MATRTFAARSRGPFLTPRTARRLAADLGLLALAAAFVLPLAWVVLSSLDEKADLRVQWPKEASFANFDAVLTDEITFTPSSTASSCAASRPSSRWSARHSPRIPSPATAPA